MYSPRVIAVLLLFITFFSARSGHEVGAFVFTYESVASVNNNPLEYVITGYAIGDAQGIPWPNTRNLNISSSCFPSFTASLLKVGTFSVDPVSDYCTPSTAIASNNNVYIYRDTVILPGTCSDILFSMTGSPGLYFNISNIDDNYENPYFYATLDNTNGPNTLPQPAVSDIIQAACVNRPLNLYGFSESDGDSVYYSTSAPSKINGTTVSNFAYHSGYSITNPVGTSQGFGLNSSTGLVQTQLDAVGQYVITIKYEEFRHDPALGAKVLIGEGKFILNLVGTGSCANANFNLEYPIAPDPDSLECAATSITIRTSRKLAPSTVTNSGSEFSVFTNSGNIAVSGAQVVEDTLIEIQLAQPVPGGDAISVVAQNGSDGNVMLSRCGQEITAFDDTLIFLSPSAPVSAAFNYTSNYLTANFNSAGSVADSVIWDFGDGSPVVNTLNPVHPYANSGQYSVQLIAFNDCGGSDTTTLLVEVCDTLQAIFDFSMTGDTVFFDASLTSGGQTFHWDFGDGSSDSGSTAQHIYSSGGTHIITLTVTNACGDTATVQDTVEACSPPVPWWTYEIVSTGGSGMTVGFDGTASRNVSSFVWDFGDGNTNTTSLTPTHTYITPSLSYKVSLEITNACGQVMEYGYRLSEIGLDEVGLNVLLKTYPNPTSDYVHIESENNLSSVRLFTIDGKKIMAKDQFEEQNEADLSVSQLKPGIYLLEIEAANNIRQVVKIRVE